jgi:hypothetical protein
VIYSRSITSTGGLPPVTLAVSAVTNLTGLSISGSGTGTITLSGVPTAPGTVTFTVTPTDGTGPGTGTVYSFVVGPAVLVSPASLPAGVVGLSYSQSITATGGTGAVALAVSVLSNPTGLTISGIGTGALSIIGTPTASGTVTFIVTPIDIIGAGPGTVYSFAVHAKPLVAAGSAAGGIGTVTVYDPQTGAFRGQGAPFGAYAGGVKVATGDVNGDGYADLIMMGGPGSQNGHILIVSGRDFSLLADYRLGYPGELNIASGDVNGDGKADVVLSSATDFDYVAVLSGASQNVLAAYSVFGGLRLGVTLAVGDFDGDGKADIIAGTATQYAAAVVVNGLTGQRLAAPFLLPVASNGVSVAAADVNGDGKDDVVLGTLTPLAGVGPVVGVYNAVTQQQIALFAAFPGQNIGVTLSSTDRNGDGRDEIITGFTGGAPVVAYYTFDPITNTFSVLDGFLVQGGGPTPKGLNVAGSN